MDFRVVDSRPRADKKNGSLSQTAIDCDYAVYRFGDKRTDPTRLSYLHDYLVVLFGQQLHGKSLEVTRYAMYLNSAAIRLAELRGHSGAGVGPGGAPVYSDYPFELVMGSRCAPEKMRGGYYAASEVTTNFSPVVIEIEATYEGHKLRVRTVHSPARELHIWEIDSPEESAEYFAALRDANAELAERIIDTAMPR
ncbi:MAG TPA: hypothetical protein VFL16_09935 [Steroidobacteraceae bacterium]|nr:hypothetical protein [Steroidobacteraceae bacterium]